MKKPNHYHETNLPFRTCGRWLACCAVFAACAIGGAAHAGVVTKYTSGSDLGVVAAWGSGSGPLPATGDTATWSGSSLGGTLTDSTVQTWGAIDIEGASAALTVSGSALTLSGSQTVNSVPNSGVYINTGGQNLAIANNIALGASQTWTIGSGRAMSSSGAITGSGGLTLAGSGGLTLSGQNTFSGGATVNGGVLYANGGNSSSGAIGGGNLTINTNGTVLVGGTDNGFVGYSTSAGKTITVNAGGMVTNSGANTYHLNALVMNGGTLASVPASGDGATYGNWDIDYGVSTPGNGSTSTFAGGEAALTQSGGTVFNIGAGDALNVSTVFAHTPSASDYGLIKTGNGVMALAGTNTYTGATTISGGTLAIGGAGQLGGGSYAGNITNNAALNYNSTAAQTLGGVISGTGTLTESGSGTLTLSGVNTYSGATAISGGTLAIGGAGQLGSGSYGGKITNNAALNYNSTAAQTLSGVISGTGTLTQQGAGTLTLSSQNTFSGVTTVNGGILALAAGNNSAGTLAANSSLVINKGGTVQVNIDNSLAGNGTAVGSLPVTINAGGTLTGLSTADSGAGTSSHFPGVLTLNGGTLTDGGTQNQSANGTWDLYDGVVVNGGTNTSTIACLDVVPCQSSGTVFNVAAGGTPSGVDLLVNGTLIKGSSLADTGIIKTGNGVMALAGTNTYTGATTISGGTLAIGGAGQFGGGSYAGNITNNAALNYNSTAAQTLGGVISGTGTLTQQGAGTLTLSSQNTFSGITTVNGGVLALAAGNNSAGTLAANSSLVINNGGTVQVNIDNSLAGNGTTLGSLPVTINAGGTLTGMGTADGGAGTSSHILGVLTLNGGTLTDGGTQNQGTFGTWDIYDGVVVNGGTNTSTIACLNVIPQQPGGTVFNVAAGGTSSGVDLLVSGTFIKGSGSDTGIIKTGNGVMLLAGTNTYANATTISGGRLTLSGNGSISNSSNLIVAGGAVFDISGLNTPFTLSSSQILSNSAVGAVINGTNQTGSGTVSLVYDGTNPSFIITNGGIRLSSSTTFKVKNTGSTLTPGSYKIIAKTTGGLVAGTVPASVTVVGGPGAGTPSLSIVNGELWLTVGGNSTWSYTGSSFTYDGLAQTPAISLSGSGGVKTTNYVGTGATSYASVNAPTNVGTYYASNTVAADANYFGTTNSQAFTINKGTPIAQTETTASAIIYSQTLANSTVTAGSFTNLAGTAVGIASAAFVSPAIAPNAGTTNVSVYYVPADTADYNNVTNTVTVSVGQASLVITASGASKTYGQNLVLSGFTTAGLTNSDSVGSVTLTSSGATNAATVGSYSIVATNAVGSGLANYSISYVAGTLTVSPLVAALSGTRAYDGTTNAAGANLTVTNVVNSDVVTLGGTGGLASAYVGTNVITSFATLSLDSGAGTNYTLAGASGAMIITNTPLVITANNDSKNYDGNAYETNNDVTYAGFVNGDTNTALAGSLTYTGSAEGAITVGSYNITPSGYTSTNYLISYVSGTLTINPLAVTVTADTQMKVYGSADPALTYGYSPALAVGDSFAGALSRVPGESVGSYAINQGTLALNTNYSLTYAGAGLTITAAPLVIMANSTNKVYGQNLTFAGTEFIAAGLTNSDSVSSVILTSSGATNTATVGSYAIVASSAAGSGLTNYSIGYSNGMLTVTQATPTNTLVSTENPSGYQDTVAFTNTLNADATGYVLFSTNSVLWSSNNLSGGVAVSLSITNLPRGTNVITAAYSGDTNYLGGGISLNQVVTNHPPVTAVMTVTRTAGLALMIALSDMATNWSDVDGDTVELTGVTMQSTNGINLMALNWSTNLDGSIATTNPNAYIGYPNSPNVADQISYAIADGQGGTNIGYINIVIQSSVTGTNSITGITTGSTNVVSAFGLPGYSYILERSTNLAPMVWVDVSTNLTATNGVINAVDTFWDLGGTPPGSAYYRLKWQP